MLAKAVATTVRELGGIDVVILQRAHEVDLLREWTGLRAGVDVPAVPGLAALDKGEGYVARQVGGWTRRLEAARTDDTGDWSDITGWLDAHQPADVGASAAHRACCVGICN